MARKPTAIDAAAALAAPPEEPALGHFEDDPIWGSVLRVKGLGDGLSKLAEVEPVELGRGERVMLVVETWVDHVGFPGAKNPYDQDGVNRLHVLRAGRVTIVEAAVVKKALDDHQRKVDAAANQRSLFEDAKAEAQALAAEEAKAASDEGE